MHAQEEQETALSQNRSAAARFGSGKVAVLKRGSRSLDLSGVQPSRTPWGKGVSENVVWYVVRRCAERMQLDHVAPHDLRRTCAKLCHVNGGESERASCGPLAGLPESP